MNDGAIVVETSTTKAVRPQERADYWSELINTFHCPMTVEFDNRRDFHGEVSCRRTDSYQLVEWTADEARYHRTAAQIRRNTDEDYRLVLPVAGRIALRQYDLESRLVPGAAGLVTMNQPFVFAQHSGTHAYVMTIPRREFDHRLNRSAPVAGRLDLGTGLGRVVAGLALGLFQETETLTLQQFNAVADRLVELLCMLIVGDARLTVPTHLAELETAVRLYVRKHADDAELSGRTVAHALGWSLRQVQLALQHAGTTPRELIREERLQLARERLLSPACRHWSVTEVAHRSGFSSLSAFSNSFRQRFGVPPRQARD